MKILVLVLCMAAPYNVYASSLSDLQSATGSNLKEVKASIPVPVAKPSAKMFGDGNSYLSDSGSSFKDISYTYNGCFVDKAAASSELTNILAGLSALKFPVLQSRVNADPKCIDYSLFYVSNLKDDSFTYVGWLSDSAAAKAELHKAVVSLNKAGVPVLQASVNTKTDGIDFTVYYLANASVKKSEYDGFLPTPEEAKKAMLEAEASLSAAGMPILESVVRTEARGSDYAIWYLVPKGATPPAPAPSSSAVTPGAVTPVMPATGCRVSNNSWKVDVYCPLNHVRCFGAGTINGGPVEITGACVSVNQAGTCFSGGSNAVNFCK